MVGGFNLCMEMVRESVSGMMIFIYYINNLFNKINNPDQILLNFNFVDKKNVLNLKSNNDMLWISFMLCFHVYTVNFNGMKKRR